MPNCLQGVAGANWRTIVDDLNPKMVTLEQLIELAMAVEPSDPLPWNSVNISPETAYSMMAAHVIDLFEQQSDVDREIVMMSVMTKLLVENFLLNLKLHQNNS
jgi:hypothetical protein